jgi:hypothetical protein
MRHRGYKNPFDEVHQCWVQENRIVSADATNADIVYEVNGEDRLKMNLGSGRRWCGGYRSIDAEDAS